MKKISIILSASLAVLLFSACEKESSGDNVLQGTFTVPYASVAPSVTEFEPPTKDTTAPFAFSIRRAMNQNVTVSYAVSGVVTLNNQTVVIAKNTTSKAVLVPLRANIVVPPATGKVTITVSKAVMDDGTVLRLGARGTTDKPITTTLTIAE